MKIDISQIELFTRLGIYHKKNYQLKDILFGLPL